MKITMAVDSTERASMVADVIQAMKFGSPKIDVVHVTETWSDAPYSAVRRHKPDLISRYIETIDDEAKSLLASVKDDLGRRQFSEVMTHQYKGFITNKLLEHADSSQSDLVAIASSGKGPIEGIMVGSVARKAAIASKRSLLVVKQPFDHSRPMTVVLATDHSPHSKRCIEEFLRLAPKGIGRVVVTTIFPEDLVRAMTSVVEHFKADVGGWLREELENANQDVCTALKHGGMGCKSRVESGPVGQTLARVMKEENADLLLVGAQGRGFVERMTLGSVSLDQVVRQPYSVLVLRA